ncbi:MAG TPA: DNA-directed RNA polymerase subunit alpha C-terminal domain-containing protein, partial [Acidimicrobiales bacterium]|nr:DNA-directed RNA polymerase subunit alpha C-terminal domain-containing protein [Acidimicrobiales bacterium]
PSLELGDVGTAQAAASELDIRIEELGLTERSRNCLKRAGINTIAQLVNATERDLTSITNFGATSLKDVMDRLDERGLSLRVED